MENQLILNPSQAQAVFEAIRALDGLRCVFQAEFYPRGDGWSTRVRTDWAGNVYVARTPGEEERYHSGLHVATTYRLGV